MTVEDAMREIIAEWDILPKDRAFTLSEITDWLIRFMGPKIEDGRKSIEDA